MRRAPRPDAHRDFDHVVDIISGREIQVCSLQRQQRLAVGEQLDCEVLDVVGGWRGETRRAAFLNEGAGWNRDAKDFVVVVDGDHEVEGLRAVLDR